jgi:hypothetical protein
MANKSSTTSFKVRRAIQVIGVLVLLTTLFLVLTNRISQVIFALIVLVTLVTGLQLYQWSRKLDKK